MSDDQPGVVITERTDGNGQPTLSLTAPLGLPVRSPVETILPEGAKETAGGFPAVRRAVPAKPEDVERPTDWHHPAAAHLQVVDAARGIVEYPPGTTRRTKVAIIGYAITTRHWAPYEDPAWEVWSLNQFYRFAPRADRWFEIHEEYNDAVLEGTDHEGWLRGAQCPVYMTRVLPQFPNSVRYPLERVATDVGLYFTSSIAYMIALAIHEGFQEIALYGIDLVVGGEYSHQKPCAEYLIGLAAGRGVKVHIPEPSSLCKGGWLYGYETAPQQGPLSLVDIETRVTQLRRHHDRLLRQMFTVEGQRAEVTALQKAGQVTADWAEGRLAALEQERQAVYKDLLLCEGGTEEISRVHEFLTLRSRGSMITFV